MQECEGARTGLSVCRLKHQGATSHEVGMQKREGTLRGP